MPKLSLAPLLSTLTIQTKSALYERLQSDLNVPSEPGDFAWAERDFIRNIERQYNANQPVRIIVLKARQLGISTISAGVLFWWCFLHPGNNSLILANERETSLNQFEKVTTYWETWPYNLAVSLRSRTTTRLQWKETRSSIRTATARNLQSGRGSTFHALHATECAFYPDPQTLMVGLRQTIPNRHRTMMILESTANGMGNWWHDEWVRAEAGESDFIPCFYPWFKHYEYRSRTTLCTRLELDTDERELLDLAQRHNIKPQQAYEAIQWRRWAIVNLGEGDVEWFHQEYPSTPQEAFITSGTTLFPVDHLNQCYAPLDGVRGRLHENATDHSIKFIPDKHGPLTIYKAPTVRKEKRRDRYFIGADPSMSVKGDPACMQVINRGTFEQVAVWHGRIPPIDFAHEMMRLGYFYHEAMLCPEVEGGGQATIASCIENGYPNLFLHRWFDKSPGKLGSAYGWSSNYNRKSGAIGRLQELFADNSILIHDPVTYAQLQSYTILSTWEYGPASSDMHDDSVMALAIAIAGSIFEGPFTERHRAGNNVFDLYGDLDTDAVS